MAIKFKARRQLAGGVLALLLAAGGCAGGTYDGAAPDIAAQEEARVQMDMASADSGMGEGREEAYASSDVAEPSVIVSGDATVTAANPKEAAEDFSAYVRELGGRVESSSSSSDDEYPYASVTARVPSGKFEELLEGLGQFGRVTSSSIYTEDVTQQVIDLDARIKVLEDSIARLQELMDQASTVEDLIAAESGLTERQAELDSLRSQMEWLSGQVDMSSLYVSFMTPNEAPGFTFGKAGDMFLNSLEVVGYALLIATPWVASVGVIVAIAMILRGHGRGKKQSRRFELARGDLIESSEEETPII